MMLDTNVKQFIEQNIDKIDNNDWDWIYNKGLNQLRLKTGNPYIRGYFSKTLEESGINILDYLDYVPNSYMIGASITYYAIPNNIKSIKAYAFIACSYLKSIILPKSIVYIEEDIFNGCSALEDIIYEGTILDWNSIKFTYNRRPLGLSRKITVKCSDGELEV